MTKLKEKDFKKYILNYKNKNVLLNLLDNILEVSHENINDMIIDDPKIIDDLDIAIKKRRPYCIIISLNNTLIVIFKNNSLKDYNKKENRLILYSLYQKYPNQDLICLNINDF